MIRSYRDSDYDSLKDLYLQTGLYGGDFDEARDGRQRLANKISDDPDAILVYELDGQIIGSISIIEDGRVAWLYRFVVKDFLPDVTKELYDRAVSALKKRGHKQALIYSAVNSERLDQRYESLGMKKGSDYTCFWAEI